jgi:hypothetical protein
VRPLPFHLHAYTDARSEIPTFLVAGHETTATLLTWTLFQLSTHPEIQAELRAECRARPLPSTAAQGNEPLDVVELERAPLLDAVLRETLRVNSPVSESGRVAVRADVLPLGAPITDRTGAVRDAIPVVPGDSFQIPIDLINMSEELWGADAKVWKYVPRSHFFLAQDTDGRSPHRWTDQPLPDAAKAIPGVFSHLLSFLGGAHACIGYKFSLYEYAPASLLLLRSDTDGVQGEDHPACACVRVRVPARGAGGADREAHRDRHAPDAEEREGDRAVAAHRLTRAGRGALKQSRCLSCWYLPIYIANTKLDVELPSPNERWIRARVGSATSHAPSRAGDARGEPVPAVHGPCARGGASRSMRDVSDLAPALQQVLCCARSCNQLGSAPLCNHELVQTVAYETMWSQSNPLTCSRTMP